jgi:hypothetical protein
MGRPARRSPPPSARPGPKRAGVELLASPTLEDLRTRYTFRRPAEVEGFLNAYPHRIPVLIEAAEVIPRYFGPDAPLVLEVVSDPEDEDLLSELFALVQIDLDPNDALDRLDRLDDEWWTDRSPDGPGAVVVSTEYR